MATTDKKQALVDRNPWKGLNFYKEGEILYGRDEEIQSLALYVTNNTQTVLYGKSGIGKSSIVNAGVFPIARQEGLFPVPIRLKHDNETAYIEQIKIAFKESGVGINEILGTVGEKESLWEYLHRNNFFDPQSHCAVRPLIVFDQFEEIFTLQHNENKKVDFFSELADLINEVTPEYIINTRSDNNAEGEAEQKKETFVLDLDVNESDCSSKYLSESLFNIVFTIREDFLSYLERYTKYIPQMKSNRYALLPLNEEQAMAVIMKPIPGLVDIGVAKLIIQKVTGKTDFSLGDAPEIDVDAAVLSLYLSRLFIKKGEDCDKITSELVNQFSKDIIKDFYVESVSDLPDSDIEKIEDQLITYDGLRNNVSLNDLINEGVAKETIKTLVEDRKLLRQFSYQDNLRVEFMHDILCAVVNERIDHREQLAREKTAQKAKEEEDAQRERERQIQEEKLKRLEQEKVQIRKNSIKRIRQILGGVVGISLGFFVWYLLCKMPYSECFAGFTTRDGFPVGLGSPLSSPEKKSVPIHYQLTRKGLLKSHHFVEVNFLNREGVSTTNLLEESPAVSLSEVENNDINASKFAAKQRMVSSMKYEKDEKGNILRQVAYDIDGNTLYSIMYSRILNSETEKVRMYWMTFMDSEGKTMKVRDNGLDRMRMITTNGYPTCVQFFSESGTPQKNSRDVYGYRYNVDSVNGVCMSIHPLDEYGDSISEGTLYFEQFDSFNRWIVANNGKAIYDTNMIVYSIVNRIDTLILDGKGKLAYRSETIGDTLLRTFLFNEKGALRERKEYSMTTNVPVLIKSVSNKYDKRGTMVECIYFDATDTIPYRKVNYITRKDTSSIVFSGGKSSDKLFLINNLEGYCRIDTVLVTQNSTTFIKNFFYTLTVGNPTCITQEELTYVDNNLIRYIRYENGVRVKSYEYEYENGIRVGRHVIGLTGTIIRCPNWDEEGLCYYRLKYVMDFNGNIVAKKAINEWGEESQITFEDGTRTVVSVISEAYIMEYDSNSNSMIYGTGRFKYSNYPADSSLMYLYLHITDTNGLYYRSGLRDGDIILGKNSEKFVVARISKKDDKVYKQKEIPLLKHKHMYIGAEMYYIFLTKTEMDFFRNNIKK